MLIQPQRLGNHSATMQNFWPYSTALAIYSDVELFLVYSHVHQHKSIARTLQHQYVFSPYCPLYISCWTDNFFLCWRASVLMIISLILMNFVCDSTVILKGDIRYLSHLHFVLFRLQIRKITLHCLLMKEMVKFPHNPIPHYAFSSWIDKTMTKTIHGHWENRFVLQ